MKDHGIVPEKLYPTMDNEPQKMYPNISIPAEVFEGHKCQPGEKYRIEIVV